MHEDDFSYELDRVQRSCRELGEGVVEELHRRYARVDKALWRKMCDHVIDNVIGFPRPAHFKVAHAACIGTWREDKEDHRGLPDCAGCDGTGFTVAYYMARFRGEPADAKLLPYRGVQPCMTCNRTFYPRKSRVIRVRDITEAEYEAAMATPAKPEAPTMRPFKPPTQEAIDEIKEDLGW